jgi:glycosyltransferase involved in cell wall biosynthesis
MARVLIIQAEMKRYRVPFFTGLYAALERKGIQLVVAYSNSDGRQISRKDSAELPSSFGLKVKGHWFFDRFIYQAVWKQILRADVVIVGSEIKYLINPILLVMSALRLKTVAYWGLGPNMHPGRSTLAEWVKERLATRVRWWFAYTASVAEYLQARGMPAERITTVQNATDTVELRRTMQEISEAEVRAAKETLTGSTSTKIGLYCGTMGKIKALPLLLDAARLVRRRCPEFHLILVGSGPDQSWIETSVAADPWIHYLGSKYGRESALCYKMADVFLLSGTAGLAVVDSFAAGLPLLATRLDTHPPEISYVVDGANGLIASHNAEDFADSIVSVLSNSDLMAKLRRGAEQSGSRYTMEAMVNNFTAGIELCLALGGELAPVTKRDLFIPENES